MKNKKKPKIRVEVTEQGNLVFTLPYVKTRKGVKSKVSKIHKDKRKKVKHKHKEIE